MVTSFYHCKAVTNRHAASMWPTCGGSFFIFPIGWYGYVRLCEIELSHMGKNNGMRECVFLHNG